MSERDIERLTFKEEQKEFLLSKIQELSCVGYTQREIAIELKIGLGTCNKYLSHLKQRSNDNISRYLDIELPNEYANTLVALNLILKEAYLTSKETTIDRRTKLHALALAQSCLAMKIELLNSGTIVEKAVQFVQYHSNISKEGLTTKASSLSAHEQACHCHLPEIQKTYLFSTLLFSSMLVTPLGSREGTQARDESHTSFKGK